jgi:hypothetical protein
VVRVGAQLHQHQHQHQHQHNPSKKRRTFGPSLSDPSLSDPSIADPSISDPSISDLSLGPSAATKASVLRSLSQGYFDHVVRCSFLGRPGFALKEMVVVWAWGATPPPQFLFCRVGSIHAAPETRMHSVRGQTSLERSAFSLERSVFSSSCSTLKQECTQCGARLPWRGRHSPVGGLIVVWAWGATPPPRNTPTSQHPHLSWWSNPCCNAFRHNTELCHCTDDVTQH